ncbi:dihydroxyacetone kinase subunit DhaK [Rhodococcus erythropolis]|jgi:dihydroxyacetone kinase-like protein|uniref:dihydroxyacetone kinase subunit DhaK n=1 Tax=Rhodococcus TaxID=1827 RepID=UPI000F5B8158|nr:dihydroxyacetone kinase subunit DhaK [Rhodococcus sp. KBW08]NHP12098.1 dihydroxyacetone kinase subunit DhaK [Rhodococcus sp. IC4_135]RQO42150.1 dihydroxyacetone kinase [Rhodococcus sp. KBW08]
MIGHVVNRPEDVVREALEGLQILHPEMLSYHRDPSFVTRAVVARDKVVLVSGGGAGHEPLHAEFVGSGMLDAAVPGSVFASPTAFQIRAAVNAVETGRGALLIVKNYTGDKLNFSIAAELLGTERQVEIVMVDDDLATTTADEGGPGRRGTAAVIAVEKICGAAAERHWALSEIADLGRRVVAASATLGAAFRSCTAPGQDRPSFELAPGEMEFGIGIHGERGRETRPTVPAAELVAQLSEPILDAVGVERGDGVIAIVNGLGATHGLELSIATAELKSFLGDAGIGLDRVIAGSFVTALDMHGLSITLLRSTEEFLDLWDATVRTPALAW